MGFNSGFKGLMLMKFLVRRFHHDALNDPRGGAESKVAGSIPDGVTGIFH